MLGRTSHLKKRGLEGGLNSRQLKKKHFVVYQKLSRISMNYLPRFKRRKKKKERNQN